MRIGMPIGTNETESLVQPEDVPIDILALVEKPMRSWGDLGFREWMILRGSTSPHLAVHFHHFVLISPDGYSVLGVTALKLIDGTYQTHTTLESQPKDSGTVLVETDRPECRRPPRADARSHVGVQAETLWNEHRSRLKGQEIEPAPNTISEYLDQHFQEQERYFQWACTEGVLIEFEAEEFFAQRERQRLETTRHTRLGRLSAGFLILAIGITLAPRAGDHLTQTVALASAFFGAAAHVFLKLKNAKNLLDLKMGSFLVEGLIYGLLSGCVGALASRLA